jgi:glycosyltransferase involved in cell wall biosynthesis
VEVIPNGVGDEFFVTPKPVSDDLLQLLFVGRLQVQKNVPLLLHAMRQVPDSITLHVVGDGELRPVLQQIAEQNNLKNVQFHGALYGEDLLNRYREADVFVLPSHKEGLSLALIEAMAAGLPVIASDVSGNREFVQDVGILVDPTSAEQWAHAITTLATDGLLRQSMQVKSKNKAANYTWERVVDQLEKIYKEVHDYDNQN